MNNPSTRSENLHLKQHGFTIVELLIVIVVIAILAAIIIVSYNGITTQAKNTVITSGVTNSIKLLRMYRDENGTWPVENQSAKYSYCLGRDFPLYSGSGGNSSPTPVSPRRGCGDYNGSMKLESSWLYTTLSSYGNLPSGVGAIQAPGGILSSAPVYTTLPPQMVPDLQGLASAYPGFTYPSKAPIGINGPGTRFYITFAMAGSGNDCKVIQYAQPIGDYGGASRCVILLEFYE